MKICRTSAFITRPRGPSRRAQLVSRVVPPLSAMIAVLLSWALASPVSGSGREAMRRDDGRVLSEIANDVLRPAPTSPDVSLAEPASPHAVAADALAVDEGPADPEPPAAPIAPAQEGTFVATPPGLATPAKADAVTDPDTADYESNTWRQRPRAERGLSFSSGVRAPASGLDPALQAQAAGPAASGREFVYGFLLLRVPLDEAVEKTLAGLGVKLLGPHDDHHKARLPVDSLEEIAALPEVEWVGVSDREQKRSRELSALRTGRAKAAGSGAETPLPIVINLFEGDEDGAFRRELEAAGVTVGEYDAALHFYRGVATQATLDAIAGLDFVLFVELIRPTSSHHDQSMALVDADMIRPGTPLGLTRFSAATVTVGIMDTGFMIGDAAPVAHWDLDKNACGLNFTTDAAGTFHDQNGHGTHVLATIAGSGTANPRYRGVATGVGTLEEIRAAKVLKSDNKGLMAWVESAMDFMSGFSLCESAPPLVINMSLGSDGFGLTGTDTTSRKLDDQVFNYGQLYVVSAGNQGQQGAQTVAAPAVAKNALTVGNVFDRQYLAVGDITNTSSRGPTGDGRMKPNVVAPGNMVTSAEAGSTTSYTDKHGTSMAAPHVTGLAATLMDHYPDLRGRPALLRSHLMATAIPHDDVTGKSNDYGLGRVSGYLAHWTHPNSAGWTTHWTYGGVKGPGFAYGDVTVPVNTKRLVVVLTWDEPAASSGASRAVTYDLDLWADHLVDCGDPTGACGEFASRSTVDNVEYLVINNPPAGTHRLKVVPVNGPSFPLPYGMTAMIVRGDTTPAMTINMTPPASPPTVGSYFEVKTTVATPAYVASGVQITPTLIPPGLTFQAAQTTRHDGVPMAFGNTTDTTTLGNLVPTHGRSVSHWFRADTPGPKTFNVRAWSENGGEIFASTTFLVQTPMANLVPSGMGTTPATPTVAPGSSFSVSDTVQNTGQAPSTSSKTRYYLSLDAVKGTGDRLLNGTHSVPGLAAGASHSATVQVSIPTSTPLAAYFLLACADDQSTVDEDNEADNCIASPGATVTVTRADLVTSATSAPPATAARGSKFQITDTAQNLAALAAPPTRTRYYLSLDGVKSAGDRLLTGGRGVAALAPGASRSGTATLTVPTATTFGTYFVLACADDTRKVVETDESNNCTASAGTVTVTP